MPSGVTGSRWPNDEGEAFGATQQGGFDRSEIAKNQAQFGESFPGCAAEVALHLEDRVHETGHPVALELLDHVQGELITGELFDVDRPLGVPSGGTAVRPGLRSRFGRRMLADHPAHPSLSVVPLDRADRHEGPEGVQEVLVDGAPGDVRAEPLRGQRVRAAGELRTKPVGARHPSHGDDGGSLLVVELPEGEQQRLVESGGVKEAAQKIRKERAASKPKPKAKGRATKADEPAANDNSSVDEGDEDEAGAYESANDDAPEDENPLVRECYDAIDEMIRVGRAVGELVRVDKVLRDITTACGKVTTRLRAGPMPPLP